MNSPASIRKLSAFSRLRRFSAVELLVSLVLLFAVTPFVESFRYGDSLETALLTLVMILAGLAVGGQRKVLALAVLLLVPTLLSKWTHHLFPHLISPTAHLGFGLIFIAVVALNIFRFVLRASHVNAEVLCAGISVYLMIGLLWTFAYMIVGHLSPGAFAFNTDPNDVRTMNSFNAFYFSFSTLNTVGFGDITPVSKLARTLAVMEGMTGMFYVAVLISRLVSMYAPTVAATESDPERES